MAQTTKKPDLFSQYPCLFMSPLDCQFLFGLFSLVNLFVPETVRWMACCYIYRRCSSFTASPRDLAFSLWRFTTFLSVHYSVAVAINELRPGMGLWLVRVVDRLVLIPSHVVAYSFIGICMAGCLFDCVYFFSLLLRLVRLVFINCAWCLVRHVVALVFVRVQCSFCVDDGHRVFTSVLSNFDILWAHAKDAVWAHLPW